MSQIHVAKEHLNPAIVAFNLRSAAKYAEVSKLLQDETVRDCTISRMTSDIANWVSRGNDHDRRVAWRYLESLPSIVLSLEPMFRKLAGERQKVAKSSNDQRKRAEHERVLLGDEQIPLREIIRRLISDPERINDTPLHLWPHFVAAFRTHEPDARIFDRAKNVKEWEIRYEYEAGKHKPTERTISYPRFRTVVAELREEKPKPG